MASSSDNLPSHLRLYRRSECTVFYKTTEKFGGLSNMASGYILHVNGIRILTSEALYQACRFPHLPDIQREILGQISPMSAKDVTKPHRQHTREDWDYVRTKIMRWCLRVKLAQYYDEFGDLLLATQNSPIVEESRHDDFWGAKVVDSSTLVGQNVLGRLLMELREKLKADAEGHLKIVRPLSIPDFNLLGRPIDVVNGEARQFAINGNQGRFELLPKR